MGATAVILVLPFSRRTMPTRIMQWWGRTVLWGAGIKLQVEGLEHVDANRPCIYMSNHESTIDIPALIAALPVHLRFVYKQSLGYVPFVGWAIWAMGMVPIDRSNRSKAMVSLKKAGKQVKSGLPVLIFPEGTRAHGTGLLPFKKGGFVLALNAGLDVVPITLVASHKLCSRNSFLARSGVLRVVIHPRIQVENVASVPRDQLMQRVRESMSSAINY